MPNDREEAKKLFDEGLSLAEISGRLKVSMNTLKSWKREIVRLKSSGID